MIVPVYCDIQEAEDIAEKADARAISAPRSAPCGAFSSSTMIVIMMAITPSRNASSLLLSNASSPQPGPPPVPSGIAAFRWPARPSVRAPAKTTEAECLRALQKFKPREPCCCCCCCCGYGHVGNAAALSKRSDMSTALGCPARPLDVLVRTVPVSDDLNEALTIGRIEDDA